MAKTGFVIVQNPRGTNFFAKPKEFQYLTNKTTARYCHWYIPNGPRDPVLSDDPTEAKIYTTEARARAAGKRKLKGWFMVLPVNKVKGLK